MTRRGGNDGVPLAGIHASAPTGVRREWRGCDGNPRHTPVIPVKTGIHAPAIPPYQPPVIRHSRENGNPRVRPDLGAGMPVIPPVIPVKTGIHVIPP